MNNAKQCRETLREMRKNGLAEIVRTYRVPKDVQLTCALLNNETEFGVAARDMVSGATVGVRALIGPKLRMASKNVQAMCNEVLRQLSLERQRQGQGQRMYCGHSTTLGHGEFAVCGMPGQGGVYQCPPCELAQLKAQG